MEDKRNFVNKRRTFKDAWAFVLYLIYSIGCSGCLIMFGMENGDSLVNVNYRLLSLLSISTFAIIVLSFILFSYLCEFTLKVSVMLYPMIQIALMILFPNVASIIFGVISIVIWIGFIYSYWSKIPVIAKILSYTTRICLSNLFTCLFGIVLCSAIQLFQIVLTFAVLPNLDEKISAYVIAAVFLNLFWTLANFDYFFKVYISSLVAYHFINGGAGVFSDSMSNTLYSLGSISYAGLVIGIVQTCRLLINRERNRDSEDRNLFTKIMLCLLAFFLALLEDIIQFANEFTMPYIAIHGCGYTEGVRESFKLIITMGSTAIGGVALLNFALGFFSVLMMFATFGLTVYLLKTDVNFDFNDRSVLISAINTLLGVSIVYFVTMATFVSSYLGLIYLYAERPTLISEVDSKISDTLKKATVLEAQ